MSFHLELDLPRIEWEDAHRLRQALKEARAYPIDPRPRRRWLRPRLASLSAHPDVHELLADDADWDQPAFSLDSRRAERLARTIEVLGLRLGPDWTLRACWVGDPVETERELTAGELAALTRASRLERRVRYRVVA